LGHDRHRGGQDHGSDSRRLEIHCSPELIMLLF
jgi:hypothetical protein